MQLKRATDIMLRILIRLASGRPDEYISLQDLSVILNWNPNLVIKVAHFAVKQGWLKTVRGRNGGVSLARDPSQYNIGHIIRIMEEDECVIKCTDPDCPFLVQGCLLRGMLAEAHKAFYKELDKLTLADVAKFLRRQAKIPFSAIGEQGSAVAELVPD